MANGATHRKWSFRVAAVMVPVGVGLGFVFPPAFAIVPAALTGRVVEPDLDHHQLRSESEEMVWGVNPVIGFLFQTYWYPYGLLHPHRGSSHGWPLGTLVRFAWFLWLPVVASLWFAWEDPWLFPQVVWFWVFWFLTHSVHDAVHFLWDGLPPWGNTLDKPRRGKRR